MKPADKVYRVLFLCTGNSARSQIAESVLNRKGRGRFQAESAGSNPAPRLNPYAVEMLHTSGIDWQGHPPRGLTGLDRVPWDFVIRVRSRQGSVSGLPGTADPGALGDAGSRGGGG